MQKIIMINGIGLETAKMLIKQGHYLLLHGRNRKKLDELASIMREICETAQFVSYLADLSDLHAVRNLATTLLKEQPNIDVLINNAGVYSAIETHTVAGLDVRFAVNTIAPYLLTQALRPLLGPKGRVINLSSATQASVNIDALNGHKVLTDNAAYAQSHWL